MPGLMRTARMRPSRARLVEERLDSLRERVARAMQPALHRSQVHAGDLGDLLVALALELTEAEHQPMVLGQLLDRALHEASEIPLPVEIVRPHRVILELDRPMILFPAARQTLEKHERAPRAVAQLVLGEVARDRVDPRRELLRRVEAMEVARHPDERFLDQVLGAVCVAGLTGDEVDEALAVPVVELPERTGHALEMGRDELLVLQLLERPFRQEAPRFPFARLHLGYLLSSSWRRTTGRRLPPLR